MVKVLPVRLRAANPSAEPVQATREYMSARYHLKDHSIATQYRVSLTTTMRPTVRTLLDLAHSFTRKLRLHGTCKCAGVETYMPYACVRCFAIN